MEALRYTSLDIIGNKIYQERYTRPVKQPEYINYVPRQALKWLLHSAETVVEKLEDVRSQ